MEPFLSLAIGLGLAAAAGFRVFVPPLALAMATRAGWVDLGSGFDWLGTDAALWTLGAATVLELGAYYVPWLDNLLDTVASPAAVVAGALMATSVTSELDPWLRWSVGLIGGGGTAALFQGLTVGARGLSSATTLGLGNFVVATLELVASTVLSLLSFLAPFVLLGVLVLVVLFVAPRLWRRRRRSHPAPAGTARGA